MPPALKAACTPLLKQIAQINQTIAAMDKQMMDWIRVSGDRRLRTAPGVGPVVAACYVLTLDSPQRMETNRQAGAYLGLRPSQRQFCVDSNPQCGITRTAAILICAVYWCSRRNTSWAALAPTSELRSWGLKLAASGGKRGKKRAIIAMVQNSP